MSDTRKGRWYKSVEGIGLELESGSKDPDFAWTIAGAVKLDASDYPRLTYTATARSGEAMGTGYGHNIGRFRTFSEAQDALAAAAGCRIIPAAPVCIECGRCLDCNETRHGDGLCVPCWWEITQRPRMEPADEPDDEYEERDSFRTLGLSQADFW